MLPPAQETQTDARSSIHFLELFGEILLTEVQKHTNLTKPSKQERPCFVEFELHGTTFRVRFSVIHLAHIQWLGTP
jgi:hypothetical protein